MTLVLLIRHAVTEVTGRRLSGRTPGIHLSPEGRAQAAGLEERLRAVPLAAIYSSPLERCLETSQALAERRRLVVEQVPGLIEVGYGRWTGRPMGQLTMTTLWKRVQSAPSSVRFPEGESLVEVQNRGSAALDELAVHHPRGTIAAVTHADVIRLLTAHYAGIHLDLFQRLIVSPASVTAILLGDRIPRILRMNDTGSFDDLVARAPRKTAASRRQGPSPTGRRAGPGGS